MKTLRITALIALSLLAACGKDPVAPDPLDGPLTGQWSVLGHGSVLVEVGIASPATGILSGCIEVGYDPVARPQDRVRVAMGGIYARRSAWISPAAGQRQLWSFTGVRLAADTLVGMGTLESGDAVPVQLVRIAPAPDC